MSRRALLSPRGCIFFFSPIGQVWITVPRLRRPFPTSGRLMWPWPPPPCSRCASRCQQVNIEVGQAGTNETLWWSKEPPANGHWLPRAQSLNYHKSNHLAKVLLGVLFPPGEGRPPGYLLKLATGGESRTICNVVRVIAHQTSLHNFWNLKVPNKSPVKNHKILCEKIWFVCKRFLLTITRWLTF